MTPKEKAEELVELFTSFSSNEATTEDGFIYSETIQLWNAKQCALIAVKEIYELDLIPGQYPDVITFNYKNKTSYFSYWEEVIEEIQKL